MKNFLWVSAILFSLTLIGAEKFPTRIYKGPQGEEIAITVTKNTKPKEATVKITGSNSNALEGLTLNAEIIEYNDSKDYKIRLNKKDYVLIAERFNSLSLFLPEESNGFEIKFDEKATKALRSAASPTKK